VEALPSPPQAQTEDAVATTPPPSPGHLESYEKLIASGDRALENGSNRKAKELYQKALHMRPAGADALAGLAFVALDRGQIPAAYELFKRALTAKPSFGPALFGMAEIHRARGEKALALQSYQRYLQISPSGKEASRGATANEHPPVGPVARLRRRQLVHRSLFLAIFWMSRRRSLTWAARGDLG